MEKLEDDFIPGAFDVICARGKEAYQHRGNKSFRATLEHHLPSYATANTKQKKSEIVSAIFHAIEEATPDGGFIRKNDKGQWCRVPVHIAREKVGQGFRDLLFMEYRSSTKAKILRRRERLYSSNSSDDKNQDDATKASKEATAVQPKEMSPDSEVPQLKSTSFDTEPLPISNSNRRQELAILHQCSFSFVKDQASEGTKPLVCVDDEFTSVAPGGQPNHHDENPSVSQCTGTRRNRGTRAPYYHHDVHAPEGYCTSATEAAPPHVGSPPAWPYHYYYPRQDDRGSIYHNSRAWSWSGGYGPPGTDATEDYRCGHYPRNAHSWGE